MSGGGAGAAGSAATHSAQNLNQIVGDPDFLMCIQLCPLTASMVVFFYLFIFNLFFEPRVSQPL